MKTIIFISSKTSACHLRLYFCFFNMTKDLKFASCQGVTERKKKKKKKSKKKSGEK